jgi:hypothetical protein
VDENEKVSEKNWLHTASATAKRFSSTIEYTDQYITESKNHSWPTFIFTNNHLSTSFHPWFFQYTWSV